MDKLEYNLNNYLPINRKEKFYTATILPSIICYDNYKFISLFFDLIDNFPKSIKINPNSDINNIQFITEFSLKESANFVGKEFKNVPDSKETPDLVILITEPELYLIVVEGKMFSSTKINDFKDQIQGQKKVIDCIKNTLNIKDNNIYHIGLVPEKYYSNNIMINCQMIFWEDIIDSYKNVLNNNYFFEMLKHAIKNYKELISNNETAFGSIGKNMEDRLSGLDIVKYNNSGKIFWVGRNRGLHGSELKIDRETDGWETFLYEVNFTASDAPNRNWFSSQDFVDFIGKKSNNNRNINLSNIDQLDPWHFSYLGKGYFLNIAYVLGYGHTLDCPIDIVYTGKSNVEYIERMRGRKVNPNWCVKLLNGKESKYGTPTGNNLIDGLWNLSNCKKFEWDDIKSYKW
jgi:hypothetical protein